MPPPRSVHSASSVAQTPVLSQPNCLPGSTAESIIRSHLMKANRPVSGQLSSYYPRGTNERIRLR